jgi:hypothetical protein
MREKFFFLLFLVKIYGLEKVETLLAAVWDSPTEFLIQFCTKNIWLEDSIRSSLNSFEHFHIN